MLGYACIWHDGTDLDDSSIETRSGEGLHAAIGNVSKDITCTYTVYTHKDKYNIDNLLYKLSQDERKQVNANPKQHTQHNTNKYIHKTASNANQQTNKQRTKQHV